MSRNDHEYNGWKNWATWNANLWLNNDEVTYKYCREIAHRSITEDGVSFRQQCEEEDVFMVIPEEEFTEEEFASIDWQSIYEGFIEE